MVQWVAVPRDVSSVQVLLPKQREGVVVYVTLRAINSVGHVAEARSDGVRLLCEPGTPGCDYDGLFVCL